jgi:hypothetical protein
VSRLQQGPSRRIDVALGAQKALPNTGVDGIAVTQDAHPVLLAAGMMPPTVTVHDALSGAVLREVSEVGLALTLLTTP